MNMRRILVGTIVLGIVGNAVDWLMNTYYWANQFAGFTWVNPTPPIMWLVIGDFAAALMFMIMWDRFFGAQGQGSAAGFKVGLLAGVFLTFPTMLFWQMYVKDYPYMLAWKQIIIGSIFYGIWGVIASMLDGKAKA